MDYSTAVHLMPLKLSCSLRAWLENQFPNPNPRLISLGEVDSVHTREVLAPKDTTAFDTTDVWGTTWNYHME